MAGEIVKRSTLIPDSAKVAVAKELAKTTAGEATTEAMQEALGILAEKTAGAKGDFLSPENVDRLLNSAIKGAIGGVGFGAPVAVSEYRTAKKDYNNTKEAEAAKAFIDFITSPAAIRPSTRSSNSVVPSPGRAVLIERAPTSDAV